MTARLAVPANELMTRAGLGDKAAFGEFYSLTSPVVFSVVVRVLRDRAQSEEVTQDIFLEAWANAARYDSAIASAITWIVTIARRRAIDRVRSSQASRDRDLKIGLRAFEPEYDHVTEQVEIRSEFDRAHKTLATLTDLQREIVSLVYLDGYTQSEAAAGMRIPLSTLKTRLRDGLLRMRAELSKAA